jgi:hypothetical protein
MTERDRRQGPIGAHLQAGRPIPATASGVGRLHPDAACARPDLGDGTMDQRASGAPASQRGQDCHCQQAGADRLGGAAGRARIPRSGGCGCGCLGSLWSRTRHLQDWRGGDGVMTNRSSRGSEQPAKAVALRRSINDGDLIRELHQGQRSCGRIPRPNTWLHPTKASKDQKPSCHAGAVHTRPYLRFRLEAQNVAFWHFSEVDKVSALARNSGRSWTAEDRQCVTRSSPSSDVS